MKFISAALLLLAADTATAGIRRARTSKEPTSSREVVRDILVVQLANELPEDHEELANKCGGHLVSIRDAEDNDEVVALLNKHVDLIGAETTVWLGGISEPRSKTWSWTDGSSFSGFTNWSSDFWSSPSRGRDAKYTGAWMYSDNRGEWAAYSRGWEAPAVYRIPNNYGVYPTCNPSQFWRANSSQRDRNLKKKKSFNSGRGRDYESPATPSGDTVVAVQYRRVDFYEHRQRAQACGGELFSIASEEDEEELTECAANIPGSFSDELWATDGTSTPVAAECDSTECDLNYYRGEKACIRGIYRVPSIYKDLPSCDSSLLFQVS